MWWSMEGTLPSFFIITSQRGEFSNELCPKHGKIMCLKIICTSTHIRLPGKQVGKIRVEHEYNATEKQYDCLKCCPWSVCYNS